MSRLTRRNKLNRAYCIAEATPQCDAHCLVCKENRSILEKLAHYEDLEEQGRLIEQKHGQWKPTGNIEVLYAKEYACSVCGGIMLGKSEFCPNCGAKMDGVE